MSVGHTARTARPYPENRPLDALQRMSAQDQKQPLLDSLNCGDSLDCATMTMLRGGCLRRKR